MKINNHIVLDFNKTKQVNTQTIQCDMKSRFVRVSLRHNNSPIDLSDVRVCIMAVKPDGKEIFNDCTVIDAQNGIAEFEITKQMGIVVGEVECQIKLFGKEKLLSSNIFNLSVSKSLSPNSRDSKDQLNTLVNTLGEVQDIDNRFNKTNYKIDENYQKVNAQLSRIKNGTAYVSDFYNGDLSEAIAIIVSQSDVKKIVMTGDFLIKTPINITSLTDVAFCGECTLKTSDSFGNLINIKDCDNISFEKLKFDFEDKECVTVFNIRGSSNIKLKEIYINNLYNKTETETNMLIYANAKNLIIDDITFNNIKHRYLPGNIESGITTMQCIYCVIDENHFAHKISNVTANNIVSIDGNEELVKNNSSATVIKTQYQGSETYNQNVDSQIIINNVTGHNFGKRLVKIQTMGVDVNNVKGKSDNTQAFTLVGVQHKNCNVKNLYGNGNFSCLLEISNYLVSELNIENVFFDGIIRDYAITIGALGVDSINNINIKNVVLNLLDVGSETSIVKVLSNNAKDIKIDNLKAMCDKATNARSMISIVNNNSEVSIENSYFKLQARAIIDTFNECEYNLRLKNCNFDFTYSGQADDNVRIFDLSKCNSGEILIYNCNFKVSGIAYPYGHLFVKGCDLLSIEDSSFYGWNNNEFADISSKKVTFKNLVSDAGLVKIASDNLNLDTVQLQSVRVDKLNTGKCVINCKNFDKIVDGLDVDSYIFNESDEFYYSETVSLTNGNGTITVPFPCRLKKYKIKSVVVFGADLTYYVQNYGSWTQLVMALKSTDTSYSGEVRCDVIISR